MGTQNVPNLGQKVVTQRKVKKAKKQTIIHSEAY